MRINSTRSRQNSCSRTMLRICQSPMPNDVVDFPMMLLLLMTAICWLRRGRNNEEGRHTPVTIRSFIINLTSSYQLHEVVLSPKPTIAPAFSSSHCPIIIVPSLWSPARSLLLLWSLISLFIITVDFTASPLPQTVILSVKRNLPQGRCRQSRRHRVTICRRA